ncbi:MAG: HlyD family secretion protein [Deltaproteobacteria bacterium]|nr:HlyD family secretion protein [Deltaproteobacteria bacterium]
MATRNSYRKWGLICGVIATALVAGGVAIWWWRSLEYVSTDDARIKADIVSVSAEIQGKIEALTKDEGDLLNPGEVLARLDSREVQIHLQQAQAELDRAVSRLRQAETEVSFHRERQKREIPQAEAALAGYRYAVDDARAHAEQADQDSRRTKSLYDRELVSAQELAHAETTTRQTHARLYALEEKVKEGEETLELVRIKGREIAVKEADLNTREAEVRQAEANLADLRRKLTLMKIISPVRGVVAKKNARPGEVVQRGQPIFMVVDQSRFWIEANVEETEIRFVKTGSKVVVRVDSYPGRDFIGKVAEVGQATVSEFSLFSPQKLTGQFIKSTQRLPVKIAVQNSDGLLKIGMLAVVWIEKHRE